MCDKYNCTRKRLFGVDTTVGSFNRNANRGTSSAKKSVHPRLEYDARTWRPPAEIFEPGMTRNGWPLAVKGGHVFDHLEPSGDPARKSGGLARNIVGDCTVKDQFCSYYGNEASYYGGNIGSRNRKQYV